MPSSNWSEIGPTVPVLTVIERFAPSAVQNNHPTNHTPDFASHSDLDFSPTSNPTLAAARTHLERNVAAQPGFVSALLLSGSNGELVAYSQWSQTDLPDALPPEWSISPAAGSLERLDYRSYVVEFSAPDRTSQAGLDLTPLAHFGVFSMAPSSQDQLLALARTHAPRSLGTPGLSSINFHRSLDGRQVINLGLWTEFSNFEALLTRPGFERGREYWDGVATFRPHFFRVAAHIYS